MPRKSEIVLDALKDALAQLAGPVVVRNQDTAEEAFTGDDGQVVAAGVLNLLDGTARVVDYEFSPLLYIIERRATLEVLVQGDTPTERTARLDALLVDVGTILAADRTLGGVAHWIEAQPEETAPLEIEGAATVLGATVPLIVTYETTDPLT